MNGPNIPHALHSSQPDDEDWERPSIAVIQFSRESLGIELLQKNELQTVREFLEEARYGFEFHGETRNKAKRLMLEMSDQTPLEQFIQALRILELFASSSERTRLASPAYSPSLKGRDISRLDQILTYLRQNKTTAVSLEETASVAKMSPKSFCRFFKANTGKTLVEYLHELRIGECLPLSHRDKCSDFRNRPRLRLQQSLQLQQALPLHQRDNPKGISSAVPNQS